MIVAGAREELVRQLDLLVGEGVQVGGPAGADAAVDRADLLQDLVHVGGDDDAPPVGLVALAADVAGLLQPVDHRGDGPAGAQAGAFRQLTGGGRSLAHQQADRLEVGAVEAAGARDRVLEQHGVRHEVAHDVGHARDGLLPR